MNCKECREYIAQDPKAYASGTLKKQELAAHLAGCGECRRYLEEMLAAEELLCQLEELPVPEDAHEKCMEAVLRDVERRTVHSGPKKRRIPVFSLMGAAAAVVILAVSGHLGTVSNYADSTASDAAVPEVARMDSAPGDRGSDSSAIIMPGDDAKTEITMSPSPEDSAGQAPAQSQDNSLESTLTVEDIVNLYADTTAVLEIPDSVAKESYAFYVVAAGGGTASEIGGTLLYESGAVKYFLVANEMTSLEELFDSLKTDGFSTVSSADERININSGAENGLLVLITE